MADTDKSASSNGGVPGFDPSKFKIEISVDDENLDYEKQGYRAKDGNLNTTGNSPKASTPALALAGQGTQGSQFNKPQMHSAISPEGNTSKLMDFHEVALSGGIQISPPNHEGIEMRMSGFGGSNRNGRYDLGSNYERASAETRALLDVEQSRFEVTLQRLYATPNCHYFYVVILATTLLLIVVTILKGFKIEENPLFLIVESILNLLIVLDFICRIRLVGFQRYFFGSGTRLWNCLDAFFVAASLIIFIVILSAHSTIERPEGQSYLSEASEIIMLAFWSVFQTARVIFIAKRQRLAQQSAKTLIDFTHNIIVVETESNQAQGQDIFNSERDNKGSINGYSKQGGADEVIVFDLKKSNDFKPAKGVANHHRILVKEGTHFRGRKRQANSRLPDAEIMQSESGVTSVVLETIELQDLSARNTVSGNFIPQQQQKRIINIALDDEEEGDEDEI